MKTKLCFFIFFVSNFITAQGPSNLIALNISPYHNSNSLSPSYTNNVVDVSSNGFNFDLLDAGVNTPYSEIGSGFFKDKLIMVSSKNLEVLQK